MFNDQDDRGNRSNYKGGYNRSWKNREPWGNGTISRAKINSNTKPEYEFWHANKIYLIKSVPLEIPYTIIKVTAFNQNDLFVRFIDKVKQSLINDHMDKFFRGDIKWKASWFDDENFNTRIIIPRATVIGYPVNIYELTE